MNSPRKNRLMFRPSLADAGLEHRVVLNGSGSGLLVPSGTIRFSLSRPQGTLITPDFGQVVGGLNLTTQQLRQTLTAQFRTATRDLLRQIRTQAAQLFANGTPTAQQL